MKKTVTFLSFVLMTFNAFAQIPAWIPNPGKAGTLQAYYGFSGNTNDLTANGLDLSNAGATPSTDRFGISNRAYDFDGVVNYMTRPKFPANAGGLFAISVWIKRSAAGVNGIAVQKGPYTSVNNTSSGAIIVGDKEVESRMYIAGSPIQATSSGVGGSTNWYHVVLDYDGSGLYCFVNGVLNGYVAGKIAPNNAISDLNLGMWKIDGLPSLYFKGKIDDLAIYSGPLTTCEIRDMYNSCVVTQPTPQTAMVGYSATFSVASRCYDSTGLNYQWQADNGTGYVNLSNAGQYNGVNTNTLTVSNVAMVNNNTQYKCIVGNGAATCTKTTTPVALTVTSSVGVDEEQAQQGFTIAPNPFTSETSIDFNIEQRNTRIRVVDLLGNTVSSQDFSGKRCTLVKGEIATGVYFVQVTDENSNTSYKKIVVQ